MDKLNLLVGFAFMLSATIAAFVYVVYTFIKDQKEWRETKRKMDETDKLIEEMKAIKLKPMDDEVAERE